MSEYVPVGELADGKDPMFPEFEEEGMSVIV
jgi:hypothetical protein